jgi:type III secretion protein J
MRLWFVHTALVLLGCSAPVARNLDEHSANQIVVALEQDGVTATKEIEPQNDGKWFVSVQRAEVPFALGVISREGLPARERPGLAESISQGSLIPNVQSEQARLLTGVAGDLERSLMSIDGIASARVHLAVSVTDSLFDSADRAAPSASVLVRYRGNASPLATAAIQGLVAGAVASLTPDRVVVVTTPISAAPTPRRKTVSFGPFAVARESLAGLRLVVGGVIGMNLLMLLLVLIFWQKVRSLRLGLLPKETTLSSEPW